MLEQARHFRSNSRIEASNADTHSPRLGRDPYAPPNLTRRGTVADDRARGIIPDDPVPLFLSEPIEEPELQNFERAPKRGQKTAITASRNFVGFLAVSAAVLAVALVSADTTRAVIVNAKTSLAAVSWGQPDSAPRDPAQLPARLTQLANAAPPSATGVQAAAGGEATSTVVVAVAPSREEISAAFKNAHQGQIEVRQPPVAPPPARKLDNDTLAGLMKRARSLIAVGDIAPARLLLERAADAQQASAAFLLAQTYDPAVLGTVDARSITPDLATARGWYQKAAQLGSEDARERLAHMQN